jgi:pyridoxine 5-phosphate synthase
MRIQAATTLPLNLEMAATDEMLDIALRHKPHAACIVPERREERTTEGGLDAAGQHNRLAPIVQRLTDAGIRVSLFIAPEIRQLDAAIRLGAPVVEFHTGEYAHAEGDAREVELKRLADMAALAARNGIEPHAGHGLTYDNVQPVAAIPQIAELNIGHYLIGEAVFVGLENAVRRMRDLMDAARG